MKFSTTELISSIIMAMVVTGFATGVFVNIETANHYKKWDGQVYSVTNTQKLVTDEYRNSPTLSEMINDCESAENWNDPKYRYGWRLYSRKGIVTGFFCDKPKRTAADWRERFITEQ